MTTRAPLTREDVDDYRVTLLALAGYLTRTLAREERERTRREEPDVPGGPLPSTEDEPDDGLHEREVGLIAHESNLLAEVTAALGRIDAGVFGRCETCGKKIARARVDALPYARQCIRCARMAQPVG